MALRFSSFGRRFAARDAARELMDDLGQAMASDADIMMLGGGNPALIEPVMARIVESLRAVTDNPRELRRMIADYASPAGEDRFRDAVATLFADRYGWPITRDNVALTGGSQMGFFQLFNMLSGPDDAGDLRRILLPLTPEYLGYPVVGLSAGQFVAHRPNIEHLPDRQFKYHIDFDALDVTDDIGAICVSRPTNPTGNVLTSEELARLQRLAASSGVPLILDNAYGAPFPQIVFTEAEPVWDANTIVCMSLSKIGLPAVRTGIVIADEVIIDALAGMNAAMSLSVSSVGPVLMRGLFESGEIISLSHDVIQPFYKQRMEATLERLTQAMRGIEYHVHKPEGAFFLWVWFPGLRTTSAALYEELKTRGVYVISGHHFFPGLRQAWSHADQCLRLSYAQDFGTVERGLDVLAEVVRAYT